MPPKKKKSEAPKRTVDDVRRDYEPKQEAMRAQIIALKQAIEVASARHHATRVDLELARDRNVLTEGRLESKREVLEAAIEAQRQKIEETTARAQVVKGEAHIKNIRVQMLTQEHAEQAANRRVPEKQIRAEQLEKDLSAFFAANPHVAATVRDRDEAAAKANEHAEAVGAYQSFIAKEAEAEAERIRRASSPPQRTGHQQRRSTTTTIANNSSFVAPAPAVAESVSQQKANSAATAQAQQLSSASASPLSPQSPPPRVDPIVLAALDEDIQTVSKRIAEKAKTIDGVRRSREVMRCVEAQEKAVLLAKRQAAREAAQLKAYAAKSSGGGDGHHEGRGGGHLCASANPSVVSNGGSSAGNTVGSGAAASESETATAAAPLQLTYIHGGFRSGHSHGAALTDAPFCPPSAATSSEKSIEEEDAAFPFASSANSSSYPDAQVTVSTSPCVDLVRALQLQCGFVLRKEVILSSSTSSSSSSSYSTREGGSEEKTQTQKKQHLAATLLHSVRKAVTSPDSPFAVPFVVIEAFVKTRRITNKKTTGKEEDDGDEEIVVMCDPRGDPNDPLVAVPLNAIICEAIAAAPAGWDQATLLMELAPADERTQGLGIMCHRGLYLSATTAATTTTIGGNVSPSSSAAAEATAPVVGAKALVERLAAASVVFQYHKMPTLANRLVEHLLSARGGGGGGGNSSKEMERVAAEMRLLGAKAGHRSHCGLLASLVTYLVRDSATPTAALNSSAILLALRGALDNPSPQALFASIGRNLRPLEQRSAASAVQTILCVPPQIVRAASRHPHRNNSGGGASSSSFFLPRSTIAFDDKSENKAAAANRLFILPEPSAVVGVDGTPRAWLCAARAEGNKSVQERLRRRLREAAQRAEAALIAKLIEKRPRPINYRSDEDLKTLLEEAARREAMKRAERREKKKGGGGGGGGQQQTSSATAAKGNGSNTIVLPMLPAAIEPPLRPPFEPFSVLDIPILIAQATTRAQLRNRLATELCSREERMVYLRSSIAAFASSSMNDSSSYFDNEDSADGNSNSGGGLVTWMSKRTMEDAQSHANNNNANNGGQAAAAAAPLSSLSRAKLLAVVSAARGRSAPEIHISGAFLTSEASALAPAWESGDSTPEQAEGAEEEADNAENEGMLRLPAAPSPLFSLDGGGILRAILTRKDVSSLPSVAGVALYDDKTAVCDLVTRLYEETVRRPLLTALGLSSSTFNNSGFSPSSPSTSASATSSSLRDSIVGIKCSFVEPFSRIDDDDDDSKEAVKKTRRNSSSTAPKSAGKASLLSSVANDSAVGVYLVEVKVPLSVAMPSSTHNEQQEGAEPEPSDPSASSPTNAPLSIPPALRERLLADFLAALSAACRDPRALTVEEEEAAELARLTEQRRAEEAAERAGLFGGISGGGKTNEGAALSSETDQQQQQLQQQQQQPHQHLACDQPWVVLHGVRIATRDSLGDALVQQSLRESIAIGGGGFGGYGEAAAAYETLRSALAAAAAASSSSALTAGDGEELSGITGAKVSSPPAVTLLGEEEVDGSGEGGRKSGRPPLAGGSTASSKRPSQHRGPSATPADSELIRSVDGDGDEGGSEAIDEDNDERRLLALSRPQSALPPGSNNAKGGAGGGGGPSLPPPTDSADLQRPSPRPTPRVLPTTTTATAASAAEKTVDNSSVAPAGEAAAAPPQPPRATSADAADAEVTNIIAEAPPADKRYDENDFE